MTSTDLPPAASATAAAAGVFWLQPLLHRLAATADGGRTGA
jgi:hypothetical protein